MFPFFFVHLLTVWFYKWSLSFSFFHFFVHLFFLYKFQSQSKNVHLLWLFWNVWGFFFLLPAPFAHEGIGGLVREPFINDPDRKWLFAQQRSTRWRGRSRTSNESKWNVVFPEQNPAFFSKFEPQMLPRASVISRRSLLRRWATRADWLEPEQRLRSPAFRGPDAICRFKLILSVEKGFQGRPGSSFSRRLRYKPDEEGRRHHHPRLFSLTSSEPLQANEPNVFFREIKPCFPKEWTSSLEGGRGFTASRYRSAAADQMAAEVTTWRPSLLYSLSAVAFPSACS